MTIQDSGYASTARVQIARAWAVLEDQGAWDDPTELISAGMSSVMLYFRYTRGAAGGDMQYRIELSPYAADAIAVANTATWARATVFSAGAVVSGADTLSNIQRGETEFGSSGAAAEDWVYGPIDLANTTERMRVSCSESGAEGTPGSCSIVALFSLSV